MGILGIAAVAALVLLPPVPQDSSYHRFADSRTMWGIPNFWNVLSNLPFAFAGLAGLFSLQAVTSGWQRTAAAIQFGGLIATAAGSAWYHLAPDNLSLFWDRLPMTVVFMSLLALLLEDRVSSRAGRLALPVLLAAGVGGVVHWRMTEAYGAGDLRLYGVTQFLPVLAIPVLLLLCPPRFTGAGWLWACLGCYAAAKALEAADEPVFRVGGISGHTWKHIAAAIGGGLIVLWLRSRRPISCENEKDVPTVAP